MVKIYKDKETQEVKERFLWKFLAEGWSDLPPEEKPVKKPKGVVRVEADIIVQPVIEPILELAPAEIVDPLPVSETDSNQSFEANTKGD